MKPDERALNIRRSVPSGHFAVYIVSADLQPDFTDPISKPGTIPLYVGVTGDPDGRKLQHVESKDWWLRLVDKIDYFDAGTNRVEAERIEMCYITQLRPVFNIVGQPGLPADDRWISEANLGAVRINALSLVRRRLEMVEWDVSQPGPNHVEYLERFRVPAAALGCDA